MPSKSVILELHGSVARVLLNLSDDDDRLTLESILELREVCGAINDNPGIRAVVLTGAGDNFCEGGPDLRAARLPHHTPLQRLALHRAAGDLAGVRVPTIAAIQGQALDQGLELALACDLRLASEDAEMGFIGLPQGVMPWDGGTQRLPRLVGRARALEALLAGHLYSAREALEAGLVNRVLPSKELDKAARFLAEAISAEAPVATRYIKEAVGKGLDMTLAQGLGLEADLSVILQSTVDRRRGIRAFFDKTTPEFTGE